MSEKNGHSGSQGDDLGWNRSKFTSLLLCWQLCDRRLHLHVPHLSVENRHIVRTHHCCKTAKKKNCCLIICHGMF